MEDIDLRCCVWIGAFYSVLYRLIIVGDSYLRGRGVNFGAEVVNLFKEPVEALLPFVVD